MVLIIDWIVEDVAAHGIEVRVKFTNSHKFILAIKEPNLDSQIFIRIGTAGYTTLDLVTRIRMYPD